MGPFGIITVRIGSVADVKGLEGCIRITEFLLVFLMSAYFLFMARETVPIDMTSCIPEITEVHSSVLFDLLVMLAMVLGAMAPSSTMEGQ